jgi:hypothetical protein
MDAIVSLDIRGLITCDFPFAKDEMNIALWV